MSTKTFFKVFKKITIQIVIGPNNLKENCVEKLRNYIAKKYIFSRTFMHSSEMRGMCIMKWPSKMLQNLPYFWNKENPRV